MALKDWKKVGVNKWKKGNLTTQVLISGKKVGTIVGATGSARAGWLHWDDFRQFKSKAKAVAYAKSYMRRN